MTNCNRNSNCSVKHVLILIFLVVATFYHDVEAFSSSSTTHVLRYKDGRKISLKKERIIRSKPWEHRRKCNSDNISALSLAGGADISTEGQKPEKKRYFLLRKIRTLYEKNFFLLGMFVAVASAKLFPSLGKNGSILRPEFFIGKFGVAFIFLLSGLSLELSELKEAISNWKLNSLIQISTFMIWPLLIGKFLLVNSFLRQLLSPSLLDGLFITTCLPTTVNMCILLTSTAGGNVASALCNAVMSNLLGIFVTPALLLKFFGKEVKLPFLSMVLKLSNQVLLPVAIGQVLRKTKVVEVYSKYSKKFKKAQELVLLGIVWNAFCNAFSKGQVLEMRHFLVLSVLLPTLHLASLGAFFKLFDSLRLFSREDVVSGMFCASHKTLAFGLPLINTIFEGNPNLASFCAPIMLIHPLQAFLGSLIIPKVKERYLDAKKETSS